MNNSFTAGQSVSTAGALCRAPRLGSRLQRCLAAFCFAAVMVFAMTDVASAAVYHTVMPGDTMWKIATEYQVGVSELIQANNQIVNPDLIYPGQRLRIPEQDSFVSSFEAEVVRLVNENRRAYGLTELSQNWELARVARYKSQDMHDQRYFSHTSPTYGTPFVMMRAFGISYRAAGENIAMGYATPQAVVRAWMNSSGHRANILNGSFRQIGVGYVADGNYWTQMFID